MRPELEGIHLINRRARKTLRTTFREVYGEPHLTTLILLTALIAPTWVLIQRGDTPVLILTGIIAAILAFFTVLIRGLLRRGSPSASELHGRTMTFWWMLGGFLVAVATPRIFAFLLMGGLCAMAWREHLALLRQWRGMGTLRVSGAVTFTSYLAIAAAVVTAYQGAVGGFLAMVPAIAFGVLPLIFVLQDQTRDTVAVLGYLGLGLIDFAFGLGHGLLLLNLGVMVLIYCFFLTELRDLVSYWTGKGFAAAGRRAPESAFWRALNAKIAPTVSPNKAWGAGVFSVAFVGFLSVAMLPLLPEFPLGRVSVPYAFLIGIVVGVLGLFGDLIFSMVKRDIGVKDSGHDLPGGTGVIDRIDSLVFTLPAVFHLIYWKFF